MLKKTKPVFTEEEQVNRLWDRQDVTDLLARHAFYYSNDQRSQELNDLWVKEPQNERSASLGYNNGYYVGMEEIVRHYVQEIDNQRMDQLKVYSAAKPSVACDNTNMGYGSAFFHTSTTPLVYIADDGKTARYLGFDLGQQTYGKSGDSADAYLVFGLVFADCIREDGEWKIWHLILEHEHTVPAGVGYNTIPVKLAREDDRIDMESGEDLTEKHTVHDPFFGWEYLYQDMPRPYRTYTDEYGYSNNSYHGFNYYEREERY